MPEKIPLQNINVKWIDINSIVPNPHQPRQVYTEADIISLSRSIELHGMLQPICVIESGDDYELVFGQRRLLAAKMAGMDYVLATIQTASEGTFEKAVIENTHRRDLNPLDEAAAFQALTNEHNYSQKELSDKTGKSVSILSETLKLNIIPVDVQKECRCHDHLSFRFLKALSKYGDDDQIRDAYQFYLEFGKLPNRKPRTYGNKDKVTPYLDKLSEVITEFNELSIDIKRDELF